MSGGRFVPAPAPTPATYESVIASVLGVSASRASAIAAEYPLTAYPAAIVALSGLVSDANFACPALQIDRWTARRVPTFAYQFNDDTAPQIFAGPELPPIATHSSEIQYLFDQPNAPFATPLNATQDELAARMRDAWTSFAAGGDPSTAALPWPSSHGGARVMGGGSSRLLVVMFAVCIIGTYHKPQPDGIKLGVVGPAAQTAPLRAGLEKGGGSAFDVSQVSTVAEATHDVRQRDLNAALVPTANPRLPATVIVAGGNGRLVAKATEDSRPRRRRGPGGAARRARRPPPAFRGRIGRRDLHVHDRLHDLRLSLRHAARHGRARPAARPPLRR